MVKAKKPKKKAKRVEDCAHVSTPRPTLEGNAFWKLRNKHGRDKLFATPELLWEAACEYFAVCDANPIMIAESKMMEGIPMIHEVPTRQPYEIRGCLLYMGANTAYFRTFKSQNKDEGFNAVIRNIEETIANQQIVGAMAGIFNGNLVSRLNGIAERTDITSGDQPLQAPKVNVYNTAPPLAGNESDVAL